MNQKPEYQSLSNKPIACTFCGAQVNGKVTETMDPRTKTTDKLCKWTCGRCGNLVRVGRPI
jgi:hypothetical protein